MKLRNTNPLGAVELHILGVGSFVLEAGEEFELPEEVGSALLEQLGNFERVEPIQIEDVIAGIPAPRRS